jgi:hypothetical protein
MRVQVEDAEPAAPVGEDREETESLVAAEMALEESWPFAGAHAARH